MKYRLLSMVSASVLALVLLAITGCQRDSNIVLTTLAEADAVLARSETELISIKSKPATDAVPELIRLYESVSASLRATLKLENEPMSKISRARFIELSKHFKDRGDELKQVKDELTRQIKESKKRSMLQNRSLLFSPST